MKVKEEFILEAFGENSFPIQDVERIEDVCIHVVNASGKIICYSKGCEIIENMKHEDVIGKNMSDIYDYLENESMESLVLKTGKKVQDVHVKYTSPSGKVADVISSTYPVFSKTDPKKVEAAICIYRDISDYIHMANTINKLQNDLKSQQLKNNGTQFTFKDIIGSSGPMAECIHHAEIAALTTAPILIAGPTGTGKEVFAQSIHNASPQAHKHFVAINCSAIPENLLESTLFGTVKGSFTGAVDSVGLLETAEGGTIFLDEINSMHMGLQSKLLRVLETGKYRKVGGHKEITANIRLLSALNQDPLKAIEEKRLRSDLYYRLAVFSIHLPPLKDRKQDILDLVPAFLSTEGAAMGKQLFKVSDEAQEILLSHDWPGNIRELKHAVTHAIYIAQYQDTILTPDLLPGYLRKNISDKKIYEKYLSASIDDKNLKNTLNKIEKQMIIDVLQGNDQNISKSARDLGISRQNLQYKIRLHGIKNYDDEF
ncbi:sigma 54-interacting transcriptional regulator [Acetobacterium wieringae]|uniref:Arginine utilization regulatory protein RocR n=2 Tax=Acetobacterium wieringae TaxID=52694 RepID=A0A1F2PMA8_9FIRM|nr:sigma 54-interacting transcriptional regulator [Acetobacterium wieringae]MEA4804541.1 sigma 54-interacting transcriptional regulator [Acetobacterium wieringae]OFV71882.1 arginine utilization regulatory protein RocR [Acetobacterium wieringae]UYO63554.1 sigma 54-interacting transcriptional regulator [Acetobacterium wieringae]VUZ26255.1 Arginine utilization regulatory protein RocR [Acetobacterium wieringae]